MGDGDLCGARPSSVMVTGGGETTGADDVDAKEQGVKAINSSKKVFLYLEKDAFGEDFLDNKLKPFYKSDPIPETNDTDVKFVVGNNFDEIILNESIDALLEIPVDIERTMVALYKFIKKHAAIPFKLEKPASSTTSKSSTSKVGVKREPGNVKDEL
ncbi:hypothetical protein RND71_010024 [Anisodus tanguticus]|uniref:Uncharacterized protein n=1 Tax=Anisodus tanguticus TaxID=243964 RepID=A0AAE1SJ45_9SOLA|nr:hypothetical protein RND71_010024 [Anisodus tanguticus]